MRCDAHPAQVEPIGVPARLDRDVGMSPLVSVPVAGQVQEAELVVRQVEQQPAHFASESGGTRTVLGIQVFVHSPAVMKDGEKLHDLDAGTGLLAQPKPVFQNPAQWAIP